MRRLHFWLGLTVAWMFLLCSASELFGPVPLTGIANECALVVILSLVAVPRAARLPVLCLFLPPIAMLLLVKVSLGYGMFGVHLPETLVDVTAVAVTTLLAAKTAQIVDEFYVAVSCTALGRLTNRPRRFRRVQGQLFREVQRARLSKQPLTLLTISARPQDPEMLRNRVTEEALQSIAQEYTEGRLAEFLREEARDCDLIAQRNHHLVAILPATSAEEAVEVTRRLQAVAARRLGLEVSIGKASFPEEELTLVGLLERAKADMERGGQADTAPFEPAPQPVNSPPTVSAANNAGHFGGGNHRHPAEPVLVAPNGAGANSAGLAVCSGTERNGNHAGEHPSR